MKIEVYTKEHCLNCETVKRYLARRGVEYVECDAAAPASRALLRELGITSAPGVVIRGESWSPGAGCAPTACATGRAGTWPPPTRGRRTTAAWEAMGS